MLTIKDSIFLNEHFELIKPTPLPSSIPACIYTREFSKNNKNKIDDTLPYISYGGRVSFDRNVDIKLHTGDYYVCMYVSNGKISFGNEKKRIESQNQLVLLAYKNQTYSLQTISRQASISLYFIQGAAINSYIDGIINMPDNAHFYNKSYNMSSFMENSLSKLDYVLNSDLESATYIEAVMIQYIFVRLLSFQTQTNPLDSNLPRHIIDLKKILDTRFSEYLTLDMLEAELGVNKYRLCRDYTAYLNISPVKYLNNVRIEKAKDLLLNTDETIVEIGTMVGIPNTTHFINLFKKQTGDTPLKYRQYHTVSKDGSLNFFPL